jgi:hypothetical protein
MTQQSPKSSKNSNPEPLGRVLKVRQDLSPLSQVILDNGPTGTITILSRPDQLPGLLDSDLAAIHEHLLTRKPGRFRKKAR